MNAKGLASYIIVMYQDGAVYEGDWQNECEEGFGQLLGDAKLYLGEWKTGKFHGFGKYVDLDRPYEFNGVWIDGQKNGEGLELVKTEEGLFITKGKWEAGVQEGFGRVIGPNRTAYFAWWNNDEIDTEGYRTETPSVPDINREGSKLPDGKWFRRALRS